MAVPGRGTRFLVGASLAAGLLSPAATLFLLVVCFPNAAAAGEPGAVGNLFVSGYSSDNVVEFDENGEFLRVFVSDVTPDDFGACGMAFGPNGNLFVCSYFGNSVTEYDGTTGAFVREAIPRTQDETTCWLEYPTRLAFTPEGRLLVCGRNNGAILAYDAATFEWLGTFAIGASLPGGLDGPYGITLGPNGNVFVTGSGQDRTIPGHVVEYHRTTGRLVRTVTTALDRSARGLAFGPSGNFWLVTYWGDSDTWSTGKLFQLDSSTGEVLTTANVSTPRGLVLAANGNVLVAHQSEVLEFDGGTGQLIGTFASSGSLSNAEGLVFKPPLPDPLSAPTVTGVSVAQADACAGLTGVTVTGTDLDGDGAMVRLTKAGEADFVGRVTGSSGDGTSLTVDFDLDGGVVATGAWDVVAVNPDGQSDTLEAAIDITGCRSARTRNLVATAYRHRGHRTVPGIMEYDGQTGDVLGWFTEDRTGRGEDFGELWLAPGMTVGPDGDVFVACGQAGDGNYAVVRFDGVTGRRLGVFVPAESGGLERPFGLTFGPNGNLFVVDRAAPPTSLSAVFEYDGFSGAFVRVVVERGTCGLAKGRELLFSEGGDVLLVTSEESGVIAFDAQTGACIGVLGDTGDPPGDLAAAVDWSPHSSNLVVPKAISDSVVEYDADTGAFIRTLVEPGSGGLDVGDRAAFGPNGNYFVASHGPNEILEYDGASGAFLGSFASAENHSGAAPNFDLVFGPIPADDDGDWDLDLGDFAAFQRCFTGEDVSPGIPNCLVFDNDGDGDIDLGDATVLTAGMTGPS